MLSDKEQLLSKTEALDLALKVVEATKSLNAALERAYTCGLTVKFDTIEATSLGRRGSRTLVSVEVSQPLLTS